jgi:hypothetical protein
MPDHIVTYEEWDSGKVKLTEEEFEPVLGGVIAYQYSNGSVDGVRHVMHYCGKTTGTKVGLWFGEVMEPTGEYFRHNVSNAITGLDV